MIDVYRLIHHVEIFRQVEDESASGGTTYLDEHAGHAHCEIIPLKQHERVAAHAVKGVRTHMIRMHYHSTITSGHRLRYGERWFDIDSVINVGERNVETQLIAVEVTC